MGEASAVAWTDVVTAVAAGLTVLILVVAAFYARNQIKCNERTRQAQLLTDISRRWDEGRLTEARKAVRKYKSAAALKSAIKKLIKSNDEELYILLRLPDFFEALGVLVNTSCLDKQLTQDLFGNTIVDYHGRFSPTIQYLREFSGDEDAYKWFDYLAEKLKKPVEADF